MSNTNIIKYSDFNASLINFDVPKMNRAGGKMVYLSYGPQKQRIFVQTPVVPLPFGVSPYADKQSGAIQSYSVDLAFKDLETNANTKLFYDKMKELDKVLVSEGVKRSAEWFGKIKAKETINDNYRELVKEPKDSKYSDTMKVKILWNREKDEFASEFYDEKKQKVDKDYVIKGSTARMLLELKAVWFVGSSSFGVTFSLIQLGVSSRPQKFVGFALQDEDEDDAYTADEHLLDDF